MKVRKKWIVSGSIVVIVMVAAVVGYRTINGTVSGTVVVKQPTLAAIPKVTWITQTGQYASFQYPSSFQVTKSSPAIAPTLVTYDYTKQLYGSASLNVGVYNLPSGNLSDDGSYHYRKAFPAQYTFTSQTVHGQSVPLASDKTLGSYNEVAYLRHGSFDATISIQSSDGLNGDQLAATLTEILNSWQWR